MPHSSLAWTLSNSMEDLYGHATSMEVCRRLAAVGDVFYQRPWRGGHDFNTEVSLLLRPGLPAEQLLEEVDLLVARLHRERAYS